MLPHAWKWNGASERFCRSQQRQLELDEEVAGATQSHETERARAQQPQPQQMHGRSSTRPNYVEHPDERRSAMSRPAQPADEVAPLGSHSRTQSRMRPLTTNSRCESRATDGRRSRNLTPAQDRTLQVIEKMVDSNQSQTELTKKALDAHDAQTELTKRAMEEQAKMADNNQKLVDAQTKLMDKCLELATRSRQPTPQPGLAINSRAVELSEQLRPSQAAGYARGMSQPCAPSAVERQSVFQPIQPAISTVSLDASTHQPMARRNTSSQTREPMETGRQQNRGMQHRQERPISETFDGNLCHP